jgi:hypothetical protein
LLFRAILLQTLSGFQRRSGITPGITRPHTTAQASNLADDIHANSGRVHAVVMLQRILPPPRPRKTLIRPKNTATRLKCAEVERYPSSDNAFNGAAAARIFADTRSGDITPGITRRASTKQARRLADESCAIRGRVHAVVMLQRILSAAPNATAFLPSRVIADSEYHLLS